MEAVPIPSLWPPPLLSIHQAITNERQSLVPLTRVGHGRLLTCSSDRRALLELDRAYF